MYAGKIMGCCDNGGYPEGAMEVVVGGGIWCWALYGRRMYAMLETRRERVGETENVCLLMCLSLSCLRPSVDCGTPWPSTELHGQRG